VFTARYGLGLYVFCVDLRTNVDYFPIHNWLVFITETDCVYWAVRTGSLCVLCGSENKQRLFPYTTLTDWFL
jgi:hypothetical protein